MQLNSRNIKDEVCIPIGSPSRRIGDFYIVSYRDFTIQVLRDFGPKWSGKVPNGVIMGGNYSQTPYGDFWTDSGTIVFEKKS